MQTYRVKVTKQAQEQLIGISDYIQHVLLAPQAAFHTISALRGAIGSLSTMPERIRQTDEEPWCSEGVRRMTVHNFYIYFWIDEEHTLVQVIAVVYARRDQIHFLQSLQADDNA